MEFVVAIAHCSTEELLIKAVKTEAGALPLSLW